MTDEPIESKKKNADTEKDQSIIWNKNEIKYSIDFNNKNQQVEDIK